MKSLFGVAFSLVFKLFHSFFVLNLMRLKQLILFFLLLPLLTLSQQADAFLSKFFAVQVGETVLLRWTMSAGFTCEDTYIERSSDGIIYERIGLIGGICGSPDTEITFEFTDSIPLVNQVAYYRLILGYLGYTSPKTVEFSQYNDEGFFLGPNPFSDKSTLSFANDEREEHTLMITNLKGKVISEMKTTSDEFIILGSDLAAGVYYFKVIKGINFLFGGKIIKI